MANVERLLQTRTGEGHNRIITLTGISGVGKDYLVDQAKVKEPDIVGDLVTVFNFGGRLLQRLRAELPSLLNVSNDDLKKLPVEVLEGQIRVVLEDLLHCQPALFLSHVVYKQQERFLITPANERLVDPREYFFVYADPEQIMNWRLRNQKERTRELEEIGQIAMHQEIALSVSLAIARYLGAGFIVVHNSPVDIMEVTAVLWKRRRDF